MEKTIDQPSAMQRQQAVVLGVNRCPFCRDDVQPEQSVVCQSCLTRHHPDCWKEGTGCSACRSTSLLVRANPTAQERVRRVFPAIARIIPARRLAGIILIAALLAVIGFGVWSGLRPHYDWHTSVTTALQEAQATRRPLVEVVLDPTYPSCIEFRKRVLQDPKVRALAKDFVWHKKVVRVGESVLYRSNPPPHINIYAPGGLLLGGTLEARLMSADEFADLLRQHRQTR